MQGLLFIALITSLITFGRPSIPPPPLARPAPYSPDYAPECALMDSGDKGHYDDDLHHLSHPGLDYLSNYIPNIKHSGHRNGHICITIEDVNRAVLEAKDILGSYVPSEVHELSSDFPKPVHVSVPAEIILKASQILAHRFHLSHGAILFGLPRIDTYKTAIRDLCPTFLQPVKCEISKYRTLTGMCNNLEYPSWGSSRSAMIRFLPPQYHDGISEPRVAHDGGPLPSPRLVSFIMHHDIGEHDIHVTYMNIAWGQLIDHDMTMAVIASDEHNEDIECCKHHPKDMHPMCMPISIPYDDPFYKFFNRRCMDFVRSLPGPKPNCPLGPRSQINGISAYLDGNFVYGSTQEKASGLREFHGGRLKSSPMYQNLGIKDLLPLKIKDPDVGCERTHRARNMYCFEAGDDRGNEHIQLAVIHTVFLREHNRIADILAHMNPHWDDEYIYQETRRIIVAEIQHITFNEFLPVILGRKIMHKYDLELVKHGYYEGYDHKINAGIRNAFQAAAYRFGHSILPDVTERYNKFHEKLESLRLSSLLRQPYELYKPGIIDSFMLGLVNQPCYRMDPEVTTEVTNHLFEKPGERFGLDLASINIQRGREMGVPGYNYFREYCGLHRIKSFYDLSGIMENKTIHRLSSVYKHVDDIDLWSAGISEFPLHGAFLGPVFSCLIGEQFGNLRRGDRFWYENHGGSWEFTPHQLESLRKVKLARMLCDNSDDIGTIQLYPMLMADPHTNPRVYCRELPVLDLSPWKDTNHESNHYKAAA